MRQESQLTKRTRPKKSQLTKQDKVDGGQRKLTALTTLLKSPSIKHFSFTKTSLPMSDDKGSAGRGLEDLSGFPGKSHTGTRSPVGADPDSKQSAEASASNVPPKKRRRKREEKEHVFPVQPDTIQIVNKPRTYVNHTYRDFSNVPPESGYVIPKDITEMTFSQKVHGMLSCDQEYARQAIEWCTHGRAFRIVSPVSLENSGLLKTYFGHSRYTTFLKQLTTYGFKRLTEGRDSGCFYSEVRVTNRNKFPSVTTRAAPPALIPLFSSFSVFASRAPSSFEVLAGADRTEKDAPRPRKRARLL